MYKVALFLHVLAGLVWVGSGVFVQLQMNRLQAAEGESVVADRLGSLAWSDKLVFIPASLIAILTGVYMVVDNDAWAFSQMWVYLALGLWVLSGIMGGAVGGRGLKEIAEARGEGRDVTRLVDRFMKLAWIDVLILVALVAMMVFKPGT